MMITKKFHIFWLLVFLPVIVCAQDDGSTKKERNFIREGNEAFKEKRYADAEASYQKALQENGASPVAIFNLATVFLKQANPNDTTSAGLTVQAETLLDAIAHTSEKELASKAYYDLGNIYYNKQDFARSIEYYKNALRKNPEDDQARENLRLAQKQLENQQNQNNQQNNNDQDKDKKEQQQQEKEQNKQQNQNGQDQNKPDQNQQKPQQPPQGGMSKENAEQILKAMQNEEKNTQDKVNKAKMQQMQPARRTGKQW